MSTMNENEFDSGVLPASNGVGASGNQTGKSIGSPSSPSSLSSASSTTSSSSSASSYQQQQALHAAVQALLQQQQGQHASNPELAKLNLDKSNSLAMIQQQQQINQLLASIAAAQQQQSSTHQSNSLIHSMMQQQQQQQQQQLNLPKTKTPKQHKRMQQPDNSSELTAGLNINLNKHKNGGGRSLKGNSVSPPGGTGSSCSDEHEQDLMHSPSNSDMQIKNEPVLFGNSRNLGSSSTSSADEAAALHKPKNRKKPAATKPHEGEEEEYQDELDHSANSSVSHQHEPTHHEKEDEEDEDELNDEDDLDDYDDNETSFSRESKRHRRNRHHSTSSPTRSTSSTPQSRSSSPSTTSYHDSPAAFPNLGAVNAGTSAAGIDSATAMLAAQSLLQQSTPGLNFSSLSALDSTQLNMSSDSTGKQQGRKRRGANANANDSTASERNKKIKPVPADKKDDAYWERRRKNNEAAKRSRDLRRQKEDEIAVKATILEQENLKLKAQVTILKAELSKLHFMLYNR